MAQAIVTMKIMPMSPDVDMEALTTTVKGKITGFYGEDTEMRDSLEPVAFGLKALQLIFVIDETKGTDDLEADLNGLEEVNSAQVIDFRRALG